MSPAYKVRVRGVGLRVTLDRDGCIEEITSGEDITSLLSASMCDDEPSEGETA